MIVQSLDPIAMIGGGGVEEVLWQAIRPHVQDVVAADCGAGTALAQGLVPHAVIGDMDSLRETDRAALNPDSIHCIAEQETTDFEKCLMSVRAPLILGVGFGGPRLDHRLANFNTLARYPLQRCILLDGADLAFLAPPSLRLDLPVGTRFSVFPMGAVEAVSEGLHWPLAGLSLAPDGRVGTSNRVTAPVYLGVTAPKLLVILPREALDQVVAALREQRDTWSAL
ncbi:thiamine diphosphokinase [Sediminimonas qiaohouensis]|uniref:thiamine diphosphokinase n=1 Tax=Sediminimonas qiaohouensis TaxID=552061 RepID=UPI00047EB377|nr:thiamine diphosphokinase [Sediminimonas qiaohouensis]